MSHTGWITAAIVVVIPLLYLNHVNRTYVYTVLTHGLRNSRLFCVGTALGYTIVFAVSSAVYMTLVRVFPLTSLVVRFVAVGYLIWLAYKALRTLLPGQAIKAESPSFIRGLLLQVTSPDVLLHALSVQAVMYTFEQPSLVYRVTIIWIGAAIFTACIAYLIWAVWGAQILHRLRSTMVRRILATGAAALLLYAAVGLSGIVGYIENWQNG